MCTKQIRRMRPDRVAAAARILLGLLFVMTGMMKIFVPALTDAFVGQLAAADIPFQELNRWLVPFVEVVVGGSLLFGFHARLSAAVVLVLMTVATYVHVVIEDPALFPLQPTAPIMPLVVIVLALLVLVRGGGTGSRDLKDTKAASA